MTKVLIIGKDKRSEYLFDILNENDSNLVTYCKISDLSLDYFDNCYEIVILPIPTKIESSGVLQGSNVKISDLLIHYSNSIFIHYAINNCTLLDAVNCFNLSANEKLLDKNALLTAKALFNIANFDNSFDSRPIMIVGMGRIGRHLAHLFDEKDAKYTVVSGSLNNKSEYKNCIEIINYNQVDNEIDKYSCIINTAPCKYFDNDILDYYNGVYYELASSPYGFDYDKNSLPKSVVMCPALPGKYYPKEAAQIIYDCIEHIIFEVAYYE